MLEIRVSNSWPNRIIGDQSLPEDRRIARMVFAPAMNAFYKKGTSLVPAGLVGGFRYRLLDKGPRQSVDVDYHWAGDLAAKQQELIALFERRLLPDVRRQVGLDGNVTAARGEPDSALVATIDLAFWRLGSTLGRIEIPVDVIRIECVDPPVARTADGVVYRTAVRE